MIHKSRLFLRQAVKQSQSRPASSITLDGHSLTLEQLSQLATGRTKINIAEQSWYQITEARKVVDRLCNSDTPYFGVNTGVGIFANKKLRPEELKEFQIDLIRSHATGIGEVLPLEASRRIHALRINSLAKGFSGISPSTLTCLTDLFNSGCVPYIPHFGTVGASGDLVPLSHIGLNLMGEGDLWNPNTLQYEDAGQVLQQMGLKKAQLQAKDGLSLMNGNQFICGIGSMALEQAIVIMKSIHPISALTFMSMKGHPSAFDKSIQRMRMHAGQSAVAEIMRALLPQGETVENEQDIQDPYSLKCIPQIHGPTLEAIINTKECIEIEMNSGSDNPLVFLEEPYIISGANFHGEYPAKQLDTLGLYVHEIGSLSSQRIKRLTNPVKNVGLPAFLVSQGGLCSGMMTWENVAASLVSENKVLCYPASAETAETCADKEDHVSMGNFSARKALMISENVAQIIAVELLGATQALQHRFKLEPDFKIPNKGLQRIFERAKSLSPILDNDRYTVPEYQALLSFITTGELWDMMIDEMPQKFFDIEIPQEYKQSINTNPF
ncbi:hypothetical protein FGO68_gene4681 [Halteria grandinella]|uniref:Histidine ammonia-lyase n=1 Tax=Halteria grandinella TaxID=5974 RepID=A0A8J8NQU2_HALGN|nr:hypothetical protein FGO68_gene4681 [Halteria grandinella]